MTEAADPAVAVIGVGNPLHRDDGVGDAVVEALHERGLPSSATATFAGTAAFLALEAMSGAERAVVVDAVEAGADPGTVHTYRYRDGAFEGEPPAVFMHGFSFAEALTVGTATYEVPDDVYLVGVEPSDTGPGEGLSEPVAERLAEVVDTVGAVIDGAVEELRPREHREPTDTERTAD